MGCPSPTEPGNRPYSLEILDGFGNSSSPSYQGRSFKSYAYAINQAGQVVGMAEDEVPREGLRGAIWPAAAGSAPTAMNAGGVVMEVAYGINAAGHVVGYGRCGEMGTACLWEGGQLRSPGWLDYPGFSMPLAINNRGEVAGWSQAAPGGSDHAVLWRNGVAIDLGTLGGLQSQALGIDDSSRVVGWARPAEGQTRHAFLWKDSVMTDLGTLGAEESAAHAINGSGHVVGWVGGVGTSGRRAFIWVEGVMTLLSGNGAQALGINSQGDVVGLYTHVAEAGTSLHAALWRNGELVDLNEIAGHRRVTLMWATAINDAGQIIGIGRWKDQGEREFGFRLTPR